MLFASKMWWPEPLPTQVFSSTFNNFLSETRININPLINISIPGYSFVHLPSPTKAGGVGAYNANKLSYSENELFRLHVFGCEDLWFDVELPGSKNKCTFAVIYCHPNNNYIEFIDSLDNKLQLLNLKNKRLMIMGDFNIDVNSNVTSTLDYLHMLQLNACINLITKPIRVTSSTQTIIDHILTNGNESNFTPGIFDYMLSDHSSIFCEIFRSKPQTWYIERKFTFRLFVTLNM